VSMTWSAIYACPLDEAPDPAAPLANAAKSAAYVAETGSQSSDLRHELDAALAGRIQPPGSIHHIFNKQLSSAGASCDVYQTLNIFRLYKRGRIYNVLLLYASDPTRRARRL